MSAMPPKARALAMVTVRSMLCARFKTAARTLGLETVTLEIRRAEEIEPAVETFNGKAGAVPVEAGVADESPIVAAHARDRRRGEPAGPASDPKSLARNNSQSTRR